MQQTIKKLTPVVRDALQSLPTSSKISYSAYKKHAHSSFLFRHRGRQDFVVKRLESLHWWCHSHRWYHFQLCCEPLCCPLSTSLGSMSTFCAYYSPHCPSVQVVQGLVLNGPIPPLGDNSMLTSIANTFPASPRMRNYKFVLLEY